MLFSIVEISDKPGQAFLDGLLPALVCILIVFFILIFIYLLVALLNKIKALDVKQEKVVQEATTTNKSSSEKIKIEDIEDDDMMAAVLVATIDYQKETQSDVRLVRVKRIG